MAAIRDTVFTDRELAGLVLHARERAQYHLGRNRQELYESFEKLATGLQQLITEKRGPDAPRNPEETGTPTEEFDRPGAGKRKRLRGE